MIMLLVSINIGKLLLSDSFLNNSAISSISTSDFKAPCRLTSFPASPTVFHSSSLTQLSLLL